MSGKFESDSKDEAYEDRNLAVIALATMASERGYPVGLGNNNAGWVAVYIILPTGQVSWHVPDRMIPKWLEENHEEIPFDGHDIDLKRHRLREYAGVKP
jgi:hypothetical protein